MQVSSTGRKLPDASLATTELGRDMSPSRMGQLQFPLAAEVRGLHLGIARQLLRPALQFELPVFKDIATRAMHRVARAADTKAGSTDNSPWMPKEQKND